MDVVPGSRITIEITAVPSRACARKTLTRVCAKDPRVVKLQRYRKAHRPSWEDWIRGGKYWHHQMKSRPALKLEPGRKFDVLASLDVIRDLGSVSRWVKVAAV